MSSNEKRDIAVPKYFKVTPIEPEYEKAAFGELVIVIGGLVVLAAILMILQMIINNDYIYEWFWIFSCCGIPLVSLGGIAISSVKSRNKDKLINFENRYNEAEPKPSDQQMDQWQKGDLAGLYPFAH